MQNNQLTFSQGGDLPEGAPDVSIDGNAVVLGGEHHKDGGNSVIDAESGEKIAETEREELLLTKQQTQGLESHIAMYDKTNDVSHLLEIGKSMKQIVDKQMVDNSGKY